MPQNHLSELDQKVVRHAAGFIGTTFDYVQLALNRIPQDDFVTRDLLETAARMAEEAHLMLVLVDLAESKTVKQTALTLSRQTATG